MRSQCYANSNSYCNGHSYRDSDRYGHSYGNRNSDANGYSPAKVDADAEAASDTTASPVVVTLIGTLAGTREKASRVPPSDDKAG